MDELQMKVSPWTSLEKAKLAVSILTPLLVLVLGIVINNSVKSAERATGLRSEIYKTVGGDLNDIYSYLSFVGGWKELTPAHVIARKRAVDKAMYTYKPFFSKKLFATYERFMQEAFAPYGGAGQDARIRSDLSTQDGDRRQHTSKGWDPAWEDRFTKERNKAAQREAYDQFLEQLAYDLKL
ncbi:conserved hypothetical protein [Burkholderiales bacterium 8X]|nr:conserved hypothetical protein [Burkholderiales bacterium 8X]